MSWDPMFIGYKVTGEESYRIEVNSILSIGRVVKDGEIVLDGLCAPCVARLCFESLPNVLEQLRHAHHLGVNNN